MYEYAFIARRARRWRAHLSRADLRGEFGGREEEEAAVGGRGGHGPRPPPVEQHVERRQEPRRHAPRPVDERLQLHTVLYSSALTLTPHASVSASGRRAPD